MLIVFTISFRTVLVMVPHTFKVLVTEAAVVALGWVHSSDL
jgi:hypothetical protein